MPTLTTDLVLQIVEAAAVIASAIAGMIVAADKRMDLIGAYALACLNAFGGGTVRDLLLDNRPFYWMANWGYLLAILAITVPFVYSVNMFRITSAVHRRSIKMDAVGLALFTVAGVGIALSRDAPLVVAVLMGVIAGTTGGLLRDVVVNELPDLFRPGGLYASASFCGGVAFVVALHLDAGYANATLIGATTVVLLRLVSIRLGVSIPVPQWIEQDGRSQR